MTFKEGELRAKAQKRAKTTRADAVTRQRVAKDILHSDSIIKGGPAKTYDIFLSHAFKDHELVLGLKADFEDHGFSVYVDWVEDDGLDRTKVNAETAHLLRQRMSQCRALAFAYTSASPESKWMPWELGYFDALKKSRVALLRIDLDAATQGYVSQEYLQLYPYIEKAKDKKQQDRLWVERDAKTYVVLNEWLDGKEPILHP